MEAMLKENEKLFAFGNKALNAKLECIEFNEILAKHKKQFIGKCKRFKKEIKDKIGLIKDVDFNSKDFAKANIKECASSIRSIVRFCRHNLKNGTMSILKTMLTNIANMSVPSN